MPDICLQHMVAVMLLDKTASFAPRTTSRACRTRRCCASAPRCSWSPTRSSSAVCPRREAIVEVTLADGTRLTERVEAVRGTPENPMTREEVVAKARDLITPVLGAAKTARLIETVLTLETVKDIRQLRPLLQRAR